MNIEVKTCNCQVKQAKESFISVKKTARPLGSILLSVLIAFFPKCPICLAAYFSMFGSFSVAQARSLGWLFPLLISFLVLHLLLLLKKAPQKGYGPFMLSLAGALLIISGRIFFQFNNVVLISGMSGILVGSLWNSFSAKKLLINISN